MLITILLLIVLTTAVIVTCLEVTVGSISTSQLQGPEFKLLLGLQSAWSFACKRELPQRSLVSSHCQKHAGRCKNVYPVQWTSTMDFSHASHTCMSSGWDPSWP